MTRHIRFRHLVEGQLVETDAVFGVARDAAGAWRGMAESSDPRWVVWTCRRLFLALRAPSGLPAPLGSHIDR